MVFDFTLFWLDGRPSNEYLWISHKISGLLTTLGVHPQWFETTVWNRFERFLLLRYIIHFSPFDKVSNCAPSSIALNYTNFEINPPLAQTNPNIVIEHWTALLDRPVRLIGQPKWTTLFHRRDLIMWGFPGNYAGNRCDVLQNFRVYFIKRAHHRILLHGLWQPLYLPLTLTSAAISFC